MRDGHEKWVDGNLEVSDHDLFEDAVPEEAEESHGTPQSG
jgi:hypothetical protein